MKVIWQGDDNVYDVVSQTGKCWTINKDGSFYHINKNHCTVVGDNELEIDAQAFRSIFGSQQQEDHKHTSGVEGEMTGSDDVKREKHNHYYKDVSKLTSVDVYRVCDLFGVDDKSGAIHHAVKKLLCSGYRGVKDKRQDVKEAVDTLNRWIEMQEEC